MRSALVRPLLVTLAACAAACTSSDNSTPAATEFQITGDDMAAVLENVVVTVNGHYTPGLTVTVNGTALTDMGGGQYHGVLGATIPAGDPIQLRVTDGTATATGDAVIPATPTITSVNATTRGAPVTVNWTSATSPDSFAAELNYRLTDNSTAGVLVRTGGSARQATIPTTAIPASATVFSVGLDPLMHGTFSGNAASGSNMNVRASATDFPVTIP